MIDERTPDLMKIPHTLVVGTCPSSGSYYAWVQPVHLSPHVEDYVRGRGDFIRVREVASRYAHAKLRAIYAPPHKVVSGLARWKPYELRNRISNLKLFQAKGQGAIAASTNPRYRSICFPGKIRKGTTAVVVAYDFTLGTFSIASQHSVLSRAVAKSETLSREGRYPMVYHTLRVAEEPFAVLHRIGGNGAWEIHSTYETLPEASLEASQKNTENQNVRHSVFEGKR